MKNKLFIAIVILCVVGTALSGVSLRNHYSTSTTDYCDLGETFNCDLVNRSIFSRFFGVPVALIGLVGYVFLGAISYVKWYPAKVLRLVAAAAGLAFAVYLAYIEARILAVWCLLCIGSLTTISFITVLSGFALRKGEAVQPLPELSGDQLQENLR